MIDTLLIDLGGVLLDAQPWRAVALLARLSGRSEVELTNALLAVAKRGFDCGNFSTAAFYEEVRRACGAGLTDGQIGDAWCAMFDHLAPMQALVERLARRYPSYLLSNTDPIHFAWARERVPALAHFRGFHLSYEVGCGKPETEYYRRAFRRFDLEPARCVLIDDRPENVEAIVRLGAQGVVHESAELTGSRLATLGVSA